MRKLYLTTALVAASLFATAAEAHPRLAETSPQAGTTLAASPKEVRLRFNEPLVREASGVDLLTKSGKKIAAGGAEAGIKEVGQLVIPLAKPLAPGRYNVKWHVVSSDSHAVRGHYSFTIQP